MSKQNLLAAGLVLVKTLAFFAVSRDYDFHRDELLYLALGNHPSWGYWSNPPMIGWLGAIIRAFPIHTLEAVRFFPLLASIGTLLLALRMTRMMGGGFYAELIIGLAILVCPPYLRTMVMFQPVVFDVFFWTLCAFLLVHFLKSNETQWLLWLGLAVGLGLLNKYLLLVFVAALALGLLLTPHREQYKHKHLYLAALVALLVWLPNLIWQATNGFPVFHHFETLTENQLVNVSPIDFLLGQLLAHLPTIFLIPLGLIFFFSKSGERFRLLGWLVVFVEIFLLIFKGKDYYALGLYPFVMAAGAVLLEKITAKGLGGKIVRTALVIIALGLGMAISPFSIPYLPIEKMAKYCIDFQRATGLSDATKWEDGEIHDMPQDYADMQGWREIADLAIKAWQQSEDKQATLIYAENYGQASAIEWYGHQQGLPQVYSFSDTYLLWIPDSLDREITTFIYVNDELGEDVQRIFADIQLVGTLENPRARERGTQVYLCRAPRESFRAFYQARVGGIKTAVFGK
ncbi:MAG: glycosyltransferase family 39 protein [Phycisphaerae bacterium]|nr:glycosyltransferase family 39 protein [Saprospiraceae bacterium]